RGCLSRADHRLARLVSVGLAAGSDDPPDPRLGPGIAALADPQRTARGGAPIDRLGLADRLERDRAAGRPPRTGAHAVARAVQISAQRGARLPDRSVADQRRGAGDVGAYFVAAPAQDL